MLCKKILIEGHQTVHFSSCDEVFFLLGESTLNYGIVGMEKSEWGLFGKAAWEWWKETGFFCFWPVDNGSYKYCFVRFARSKYPLSLQCHSFATEVSMLCHSRVTRLPLQCHTDFSYGKQGLCTKEQ